MVIFSYELLYIYIYISAHTNSFSRSLRTSIDGCVFFNHVVIVYNFDFFCIEKVTNFNINILYIEPVITLSNRFDLCLRKHTWTAKKFIRIFMFSPSILYIPYTNVYSFWRRLQAILFYFCFLKLVLYKRKTHQPPLKVNHNV